VLFVVLAAVVEACGGAGSDQAASSGGGGTTGMAERAPQHAVAQSSKDMAYGSVTTSGAGTGVADALAGSTSIGPSVIKTANVEVAVDKDGLEGATRQAISIAGRFGGFVLSTESRDERDASSIVTVRVPADSFERALAELENLGDVKTEQISGEDVGQEFIDLEARERNLESQETVLLRLMDRSVTVSDTIRVQRELQGVQLEIERLTGRLRYLKDQADMGTLTVSFVEVGAPAHEPPSGVVAKAWAQAKDVALKVVAAVIVGFGFLVPVGFLAALGYLLMRMLRPRFGVGGS
jgi:hypothetical protein